MDRNAIEVIAKPMSALIDLFQLLGKSPDGEGKWRLEEKDTFIDRLADVCYEMEYHFHLGEDEPAWFDQYNPEFQEEIKDLLKSAVLHDDGYVFERDALHTFIEAIVIHVLKLVPLSYRGYTQEEIELLIELTIATIESRFEKFSYGEMTGANPAYPRATVSSVKPEYLPGMAPRRVW